MASSGEGENNIQKKLQKSYFDVLGICCPSEVPPIEDILKSLDGVKEFSVIVPSRIVIVVHDSLLVSQHQIVKALNQARLEANVRLPGETSFKEKWPNPFVVVSGILLALSFLKYAYSPFQWVAVAAVAAGIFPLVSKSFASIKRFRIDINILALIAVIGTMAMTDYTEAGTVVFLFSIAEWLETRASCRAGAVMLSLMSLAPQKAIIAETGEEVEVGEVKLDTIVAVKAGETIPVDGIVVDGNCEADEKTLTGEPFPVSKQRESVVWAGTTNLDGYITVKTTALAEDCVVAKMAKLVEDAQNSKTKTQRFIDKCSQYYTPAVVIVAACFAAIPAALRVHNLDNWFHLALVVLVSACPCGLILSTPVATFCALAKAATSGLLIKGGDYLETLARIKVVAFDKTGTVTRGEFVVLDFQSLSQDISLHNLLYWVSSIESKSSHPLASALVDYAKLLSVEPKPGGVEDYQNFPGEGIYGKIDGKDIYIGNKRIALRAGSQTVPELEVDVNGGKTVGYVYVGGRLAGILHLSDACRSGVAQAINELKSLGLKVAMLTGDNHAAAMHAQEQLENGLDVVHAELLPEDKAKIINEFKKEGATAMIGDGLNDAPALASADIGIAMGISGSALATETGHIILMSNDIRKIPKAIRLARKAHRKVIENVFLSIAIKGGILVAAFAGHPLVSAAVLGDVGSCLLVILNSMLLLRETYKPAAKCYRASVSNAWKLASADTEDLEAGLLDKTCNSSCCPPQKNIKKVKPALSEVKNSDCCGVKQNEKEKIVAQSFCAKPVDLGNSLVVKNAGNCISVCCGSIDRQAEQNVMKKKCSDKPDDLESKGNCKSGCCGKKERLAEKILTHSCIMQPDDLQKKSDENSKSGCCQEKEHAKEEKIVAKTYFELLAGFEEGPRMKSDGNCNSGCSGGNKKGKEKAMMQSLDVSFRTKNKGNCKSSCCGNEEQPNEKICCEEKSSETKDEACTSSEECQSDCMGPKRRNNGGCCRNYV